MWLCIQSPRSLPRTLTVVHNDYSSVFAFDRTYGCGRSNQAIRDEAVEFLRRGQVPPTDLLTTEIDVELVYNGTKYTFVVKRSGPNSFLLSLPGGTATIQVQHLSPIE